MANHRTTGPSIFRLLALIALTISLTISLGAVLLTFNPFARAASTYHPQRRIPFTDVNPLGANTFLHQEVEPWKVEKTLEMARDAGIGWIKQQFPWEEIEPRQGRFLVEGTLTSSWEKFDRIVDLAEKYNIKIIARLDRPPAWTKRLPDGLAGPPDNYNDYGDFVYTFVNRYKGRIQYIQIWNEPNLWYEWGGTPNPRNYTALLRLAYRRAKEADPHVVVLSAPLAPTLENSERAMNDLDFLQAMYDAGAGSYFDILSANAFGQDRPPDDPPDPNVLNFARVVLLRQIMERNGDTAKPIWINEYGWNASPPDFPAEKLIWQRVSEQTQADYTLRGIKKARSEWEWVGVISLWYLRQVGNILPDRSDYYFRLIDTDWTMRLVYRALKAEAPAIIGHGAGYFEESHGTVVAHLPWRTILSPQASGGAYLECQEAGASLTFSFQGTELDLVTRRDERGGRLFVTIDGRAPVGLPRDGSSNAYVDLYNSTERWQEHIPLARNLSPGPHVAKLTVAATTNPASRGTVVNVDGFVVEGSSRRMPTLFPIALGINLAGLGLTVVFLGREAVRLLRRSGHQ
jgi:hypothetical protein